MKRLFWLLSLALCLTLLLCMTGCGEIETGKEPEAPEAPWEPKSAEELWNKINSEMSSLSSYRTDVTADILCYVSDLKLSGSIEGSIIHISEADDGFYYYSTAQTEMESSEGKSEVVKTSEIYEDGTAYISVESSDASQKIRSDIPRSDFITIFLDGTDESFDETDCTEKSFTKNEDGSWCLIHTGFSKEALTALQKYTKLDSSILGEEPTDLELTVSAGSDFRTKKMLMKFLFASNGEEDNTPGLTMEVVYSDLNSASKVTPAPNPQDFHEFENIILLYEIEDMFRDIEEYTEGSFVYTVTQAINLKGSTQTAIERNTVSFGEEDEKYYYNVDTINQAGMECSLRFKNGYQYISIGGEVKQMNKHSEAEAKVFIKKLINNIGFATQYISSIESKGEGEYEIIFKNPSTAQYQKKFTDMGAAFEGVTQSIFITVKNGRIIGTESYAVAQGTIQMQGFRYDLTLTETSKTVFDHSEEIPDNIINGT